MSLRLEAAARPMNIIRQLPGSATVIVIVAGAIAPAANG